MAGGWLRTVLSFVALQNAGTTLQCLLDCDQFAPKLSTALCRQISVLNAVLFFVRIHTVFAVGQKASHALNIAVSTTHLASLLHYIPTKVTPALSLQIIFSTGAALISLYALIYHCEEEGTNPPRRTKPKDRRPVDETFVHHLRSRVKDKNL
uniref:EamA domain-containing protein n=1 Tax=Steinernema glaseri TaxID=37863 RepID=A0A1I7ZV17_9BILA